MQYRLSSEAFKFVIAFDRPLDEKANLHGIH